MISPLNCHSIRIRFAHSHVNGHLSLLRISGDDRSQTFGCVYFMSSAVCQQLALFLSLRQYKTFKCSSAENSSCVHSGTHRHTTHALYWMCSCERFFMDENEMQTKGCAPSNPCPACVFFPVHTIRSVKLLCITRHKNEMGDFFSVCLLSLLNSCWRWMKHSKNASATSFCQLHIHPHTIHPLLV